MFKVEFNDASLTRILTEAQSKDLMGKLPQTERTAGTKNLAYLLDTTITNVKRQIPNVLVIDFIPSIGVNRQACLNANVGSQAAVETMNGGAMWNSNVAPEDVTIRIYASAGFYEALSEIRRALDTYNALSEVNAATGRLLIQAMGWQYSELSGNFTNLVAEFNNTVNIVNQLVVPAGIPGIDRHMQMCSEIYADDTHEKTTFVIFKCDGWYFNLDSSDSLMVSTVLKRYARPTGATPISTLLLAIQAAANRLLNSATYKSDIAPILRKAYTIPKTEGGYELGPVFYFKEITELLPRKSFTAIYDPNMHTFIRNIALMGKPVEYSVSDGRIADSAIYPHTDTLSGTTYLAQGRVYNDHNNVTVYQPYLLTTGGVTVSPDTSALASNHISLCATSNGTNYFELGHYPKRPDLAMDIVFSRSIPVRYAFDGETSGTPAVTVSRVALHVRHAGTEVFTVGHLFYLDDNNNVNNYQFTQYIDNTSPNANIILALESHPFVFIQSIGGPGSSLVDLDFDNAVEIQTSDIQLIEDKEFRWAYSYSKQFIEQQETQAKPNPSGSNK